MQLFKQHEITSYWIAANKIPLGRNPDNPEKIIFKILPRISDSLIISASPGRGKSVIFRLLNWFISQIRPTIMFDWEGEDHKLSYYPNSKPINLPPYIRPSPIPRALFFSYPSPSTVAEDKEKYEEQVIPNLNDYNSDELRGMGFPVGSAMELKRILKQYGEFKDLMEVYEFIKAFPTNERESKTSYKDREEKKKYVNLGDSIPSQTKQSLLKYLYSIIEKNLFCLTYDKMPFYIDLLKRRYNLFLNFNGFVDLARVEISKRLSEIIKLRKKDPDGVAPAVFYEEADRIIPRYIIDSEEKKKVEYVLSEIVNASLRARKLRVAQYFNTPSLSNLHRIIVDNSNEKIFGEMSGFDLMEVKRCTDEFVMNMVTSLKFNRYRNIREFVFRNEFKNTFKFIPFECPQELHRE